jgi:Transposase and inactivated derivatives
MLSRDFAIADICALMGVSRAGYYKWKHRKPSTRDINRDSLVEAVKKVHDKHSTHGYRWVAAFMRNNFKMSVSDNLVYKCFRYLGIQSETRHKVHYKPRKVRDRFPNLIFSTWDTVDRPRQVIVSDMTVLRFWIFYFELTFYFDVFTKELLSWKLAEHRGGRDQYVDGLLDVINLLKGSAEPVILHTDQGSVYASMAYNELIKDSMIVRSMSRAGKPTDNPVNEALNGWIKEELMIDFHIDMCHSRDEVKKVLEDYVLYYDEKRPCFAIGYDTPAGYRNKFYKGELTGKDTFSKRTLSDIPKFVQKRMSNANIENDG